MMINSFVITIVNNYYLGHVSLKIELVQTFILKDFDEKDLNAPESLMSHGSPTLSANSWALTWWDLLRLLICLWVVKERILSCEHLVCVPPLEQSTSLFHVSIPVKREVSPLQSPPLWHFHSVSPTEITKSSLSARKSSKPFKSCPALRVLWESDRCTYRELHLDGRPGQLCW